MKAIRKFDGKIIGVVFDPDEQLFVDARSNYYKESDLDINLPEEKESAVIEGWVMRDDDEILCVYYDKPTCDDDGFWDLTGENYPLPKGLFPQITCQDQPKKVRIQITPME